MYDLALREYAAVVDQPGLTNREVVLYRMAESLRALGRAAEADAAYDRVVTGFPESVQAQRSALRMAETAVAGGRFEQAATVLRTRAEGSLELSLRPAWRYYRAHAELKRGRPKLAEPIYRRLLEEDGSSPYAPHARLELAELLQAENPAAPDIRRLLEQVVQSVSNAPVGRQAALRLAAYLYGQRDFAASADVYSRILRDDPAQAESVQSFAAWAAFKAGRWEETLRLAGSLGSADGLYVSANSQRQLGRTNEARQAYASLLAAHADNALAEAARYEAAALALQAGDFVQARQLAGQVKPTPELGEDLLWIQAEAARGAGQRDDAIVLYDRLAQDYAKGSKALAARMSAARLHLEASRWEEASRRYRALARDPAGRPHAAETWLASAYARTQLKQPAEAVADWTVLIREYPSFGSLDEALYGCARAQAELGQNAAARDVLVRLLKDFPASKQAPEAHYLLGTLLEADEKWEEAGRHYQLAARDNPDGALARRIEFRRVAVLQRQGRPEEAASVLNGLLSTPAGAEGVPAPLLDWLARWNLQQQDWPAAERAGLHLSGQGGAWTTLGWFQTGRAREELGQRDPAREAYRKALSDKPTRESVEAAYRLGRLALSAGDADEAKSSLTRAAEQASTAELADLRARSYFGLAELEEKSGQADQAARTFLSVALLYDDPELTPEALYRAAQTLSVSGRKDEAEQTRRELRQRYPGSAWAKKLDSAP